MQICHTIAAGSVKSSSVSAFCLNFKGVY